MKVSNLQRSKGSMLNSNFSKIGIVLLTVASGLGLAPQVKAQSINYIPLLPLYACPNPTHNMYPVALPQSSSSMTIPMTIVRRCAPGVVSSIPNWDFVRNLHIGENPASAQEIALYGPGMLDVFNYSKPSVYGKFKKCKNIVSNSLNSIVVDLIQQPNGSNNANVFLCQALQYKPVNKLNGTILQQRAVLAKKIHSEMYLQGQYQATLINASNQPNLGPAVKVYDHLGNQLIK